METITLAFRPVDVNEVRFSAAQVFLSLAASWEAIGEPAKAEEWRRKAHAIGWRPEFNLTEEVR